MSDTVTKEFVALCRDVAKTGKAHSMTVRQLLGHFGQERRGREVIRFINYKLRYLGLGTDPRFDEVHIDSTVDIIPRPKRPPGRPRSIAGNGKQSSTAVEAQPTPDAVSAVTVAAAEEEEEAEQGRRPYLTIGLLASANRKPHCVRPNDDLKTAVTLMLMNKISHVPVMQSERVAEGVITWRSIGQAKAGNREAIRARDCLEPVRVLSHNSPLFDAVRDIIQHGVILVQGKDKTICGLVTAKDIAEQFVALSEPFLFLEQIENHLRGLLQKAKLTKQELCDLIDPVDSPRKATATKVDELTFGEYLRGLSRTEYWGRLKLEIDRNLFVQRLDAIRQIRNNVTHFHPDGISSDDRELLAKTREMLQGL
jgi:CBS domain-containing protein